MSDIFKPGDESQVVETVQWAVSNQRSMELIGNGSKQLIGNLMETNCQLDLSDLTGISLYEPEELVLSAGVGCSVNDINEKLAKNDQAFAFEAPDFSHLLGSNNSGTIGGMVASGLAGPRRVISGGVRDHVLGVRAISGRGEVFKSGGRVMKNVTGYDLPKILTGSWGTLAVMSEITLKVLPRPETEATLAIIGLDNDQAMKAMSVALGAPVEVSGAAHIPDTRTLLRLEGIAPSVAARLESLKILLASFGELDVLNNETSREVWKKIRDVQLLGSDINNAVWRLCVPPSQGAGVLEEIKKSVDVNAFFDWGGGLMWIEVLNEKRACAAEIRTAVAATGGHATLIRATEKSRAGSSVFQPQSAPLTMLSERLKNAFDPKGILNPGRMKRLEE